MKKVQATGEILALQNIKFLHFSFLLLSLLPSWIRIRIRIADPDTADQTIWKLYIITQPELITDHIAVLVINYYCGVKISHEIQ